MKLVIWSELAKGGIADYAHDQAAALAARGLDVEMLCPPSFLEGRSFDYPVRPVLRDLRPVVRSDSQLVRAWRLTSGLLANARTVACHVEANRPDAVLTHFSEYMAPLWAWRMRRLRSRGVGFHSVLHDPVRNHVVGPPWWHARSLRDAFSFLDTVFVHSHERVPVPPEVAVHWVPYGIHSFPDASRGRADVRRELGVPEDAKLLTSFGYIRDNKNLDLILRAIADLPHVYLLVAGSEQAGGNRPVSYYQALAEELGCADRCRWLTRFVSAEESADLMCASDLSLLVYARSFVSSSAALGVTANYRLPCLISSGSKSNEAMVKRYRLGVWVEPDSAESIRAGLLEWLSGGLDPDWAGYRQDYSWARNARIVHEAILATPGAGRQQEDSAHD